MKYYYLDGENDPEPFSLDCQEDLDEALKIMTSSALKLCIADSSAKATEILSGYSKIQKSQLEQPKSSLVRKFGEWMDDSALGESQYPGSLEAESSRFITE